jgi:6-phosphogluconolactonase
MPSEFHAYADAASASRALAEFTAERLSRAVDARGAASLVVSGGRSPIGFFHALSATSLPWSAIVVALADERCVPAEHPDSNTALVREHLLTGAAQAGRFVSMATGESPEKAAAVATANLADAPAPFDVTCLGMGEDGHTASLFPDSPQLAAALEPSARRGFMAIQAPSAKHPRLTLTRAALDDSRVFTLLLSGDKKRTVYERALTPGPVSELPIRIALHHSSVTCHVFWNP